MIDASSSEDEYDNVVQNFEQNEEGDGVENGDGNTSSYMDPPTNQEELEGHVEDDMEHNSEVGGVDINDGFRNDSDRKEKRTKGLYQT